MQQLAENIQSFCEAVDGYAYVLTMIVCLVVGIMLALPSEKAHEKAKSYGGWAIVGSILISGCVTIGQWVANQWSF